MKNKLTGNIEQQDTVIARTFKKNPDFVIGTKGIGEENLSSIAVEVVGRRQNRAKGLQKQHQSVVIGTPVRRGRIFEVIPGIIGIPAGVLQVIDPKIGQVIGQTMIE